MAKNIVVPVDFSDVSDLVVAEARCLAKAMGAKTWLIHVAVTESAFVGFEFGLLPSRDRVARELRHEHRRLEQYEEAFKTDDLDVTSLLVSGPPAAKIIEEARRLKADLIILGSHAHGALHHLLSGSVCEVVLMQAICPIVIVPSKAVIDRGSPAAESQPAGNS